MRVSTVLGAKGNVVASTAPDTTVADVLRQLAEHGVGALIVSEDGRDIRGIVSERDVVRAIAARGREVLDGPVAAIMTTEVLTCAPSTSVQELAALMTERRIRHVPVIVDGVLGGIVSIGDVVKSRITELETETDAIREYVWNGH
ncbi:MAG TPA: CBS domain-containing protein [Acidimicrobiales bacterium]|jgi:CBS domain-containing protein